MCERLGNCMNMEKASQSPPPILPLLTRLALLEGQDLAEVGLEQTRRARQGQHDRLVPLLGLTVVRVVDDQSHRLAARLAQQRLVGLVMWWINAGCLNRSCAGFPACIVSAQPHQCCTHYTLIPLL